MAHLGDRVAALVDGQLADDEMAAADEHLAECAQCRATVAQQRALKRRMTGLTTAPPPPASLVSTLTDLDRVRGAARPTRSRIWVRVLRSRPARTAAAFTGASVIVGVAAYAAGAPAGDDAQPVTPPVDTFVAKFATASTDPLPAAARVQHPGRAGRPPVRPPQESVPAPTGARSVTATILRQSAAAGDATAPTTATTSQAGRHAISAATMSVLTRSGWPCHPTLSQGLRRVSGAFVHLGGERVVALTYTDGSSTVALFEQSGALDTDGLSGFEPVSVGSAQAWIRDSDPAVATWSADGVLYTAVGDGGRTRLEQVVAALPRARADGGPGERLARGISRLSDLAVPADFSGG